MTHSLEEIRTATIDALIASASGSPITDYYNLKIAVGDVLQARDGSPAKPRGMYAADSALETADANKFLEVFWDLFRDGVITLGYNDANKVFPAFRTTARTDALLAGGDTYFLHDVSGFDKQLRTRIPGLNDTTLLYLKEALQAFRSGCILSSSVMVGVATEHTFNLLQEAIEANPKHSNTFAPVRQEKNMIGKVTKFIELIRPLKASLPKDVRDDFDTNFLGILSLIRTFRNESGHPSGLIIEREQAFVNLQLFVSFGRKAYLVIDYFKRP